MRESSGLSVVLRLIRWSNTFENTASRSGSGAASLASGARARSSSSTRWSAAISFSSAATVWPRAALWPQSTRAEAGRAEAGRRRPRAESSRCCRSEDAVAGRLSPP